MYHPTYRIACTTAFVTPVSRGALAGIFFYTMHSTHFYLKLNGIRHMLMGNLDNKTGNLLLSLHGQLFPMNNNDILYAPSQRQDSTYHGVCYASRGALDEARYS